MIASEAVLEKAARLVEENRVVLSRRARNCAVVAGDTDHYEVWAMPDGLHCECYQATNPERLCSHAAAAMVAFFERDEAEPTPPPVHSDPPPAGGFAALLGGAV